MSSRYLLSPAARADLDQIWAHTHDGCGAVQAETYLREFQHAIERAATNPRIGRVCDETRPGYHRLPAGSHVLFHRVTADGIIDVVRILHQRMDIDRHL